MAGVIEALLTPSGRVNLGALARFARSCDVGDFSRFVRRPVLAGSSVQPGMIAGPRDKKHKDLNATFAFRMNPLEGGESISDVLKQAVYPLVKAPDATRAENIFTIGRVSGNDFVIPDLAISKRHAIIEIRDETYFIRDCGSTNGTTLNGKNLGEDFRQLLDGFAVGFARYEFSFLSPKSLYFRLVDD